MLALYFFFPRVSAPGTPDCYPVVTHLSRYPPSAAAISWWNRSSIHVSHNDHRSANEQCESWATCCSIIHTIFLNIYLLFLHILQLFCHQKIHEHRCFFFLWGIFSILFFGPRSSTLGYNKISSFNFDIIRAVISLSKPLYSLSS